MKPFQSYLFELAKTYDFRIKIATINPSTVMEQIKHALDTWQLESVSAVKSVPIQEHREFPQSGPCECWTFDIAVSYPCNAVQIRQTIKERAQLNTECISVRNLHEATDTDEAEARGKDRKGALLDDPELTADPQGQTLVGQERAGSLLKELESRKFEFAQNSKEAGNTTNDSPMGVVAPVGSKQNAVYRKPKGN